MPRVLPEFEEEMRAPVRRYYEAQGYRVKDEVKIHTRVADLVAFGSDIVAVELKVHDWIGAVRQAQAYQLGANRTYIAIPRFHAPRVLRQTSLLRETGVGVLTVDPLEEGATAILMDASDSQRYLPYLGTALRKGLVGKPAWRYRRLLLANEKRRRKPRPDASTNESR